MSDSRPAITSSRTRARDGLLVFAAVIALWQGFFAYAGEAALASPLQCIEYGATLLRTPSFWSHVAATAAAFGMALAISVVVGVILGLVLGLRRFAGDVAEPFIVVGYTIPKITLYPLILLIFGLGTSAKVAFGVIHGVVPIALITLNAVKNVSPVLVRTARAMRLTGWQTLATVLGPAVLPELFTGVRIGFSLTLLGVLIGEMFASQRGIGFLIINGISLHNVRLTTTVISLLVAVAVTMNVLLMMLDRRLHPGRSSG